jgi:predicted O-linked N-acetylglucosamine transferase (SPINDLY family)
VTLETPPPAEFLLRRAFELHQQGRLDEAVALYEQILRMQPQHGDTWHLMGIALSALGRNEAAVASFTRAISLQASPVDAHFDRGNALYNMRRLEEAVADYDETIALRADHASAYNNRGLALMSLQRFQASLSSFERALAIQPDDAEAHCNRGSLLLELGQWEAALAAFDHALILQADTAEAHANRGVALRRLGRLEAALVSYDRAIAIRPEYAEAYSNRGVVLKELKAWEAARASFERAVSLDPQHAQAHLNRGELYRELQSWKEALSSYDRAIEIHPHYAEGYYGRGEVHRALTQYPEAAANYERALALDPDIKCLFGTHLHVRMMLCDWTDFEANLAQLAARIERGEVACLPHAFLAACGSAALQRRVAEIWMNEECPPNPSLPSIPRWHGHEKIRIGYFSPDFRDHPVSRLTAELFELHDRTRFEITAFSWGPNTDDEMRERLQGAFDRFIDVRAESDRSVALSARSLELDIAVDLAGFTGEGRPGVFALRAAPLQIGYIGYLGTMAAPYMDYLIADPILVPPDYRQYYAEQILYLPSYQANDSKRRIAAKSFTRQELGLPATGFVFCCFNANYKITPTIFSGWMRILGRVPGSALLLYAGSPRVQGNLRAEAQRRGVDPARLVFAESLPAALYLARYRAADLFLDTLPYNAGTTASDALWAGLPVLTCAGEAFASRMGASLLTAIHLPELITSTPEEYEALAIELATHPERLGQLKQRLADHRLTTPLFDSRRFTANLEEAYLSIYRRYRAELAPLDTDGPWRGTEKLAG